MRFHQESREAAYDVVVVGSGIGGLTTGALLARLGKSVLVVERHDRVGGYCHSFRRGHGVVGGARRERQHYQHRNDREDAGHRSGVHIDLVRVYAPVEYA